MKLPLVELGEVCLKMHQGINTAADKINYSAHGYYILQSKHITRGFIDYSDARLIKADLYEKYKDKYKPQIGDVLFCNIGTIGSNLVIKEDKDFLIAWNLFLLKPDLSRIDSNYLHYFLNSLKSQGTFNQLLTGGTVKFINKKQLSSLKIPLPPLEEQRRIAAILDKADAVRRKRQQAIRLTEELLRSAFLEMFGDPSTNPKGWKIARMSEVVSQTQYGTAEKANSEKNGIPVLRMNNITYRGEFNLNDLKWCPIPVADEAKFTVRRGDLLFN